MTRTLLLILLIVSLTACGPARLEETQQPLPTASTDWTWLTFTQSGGIMGMLRTFEISRDGAWTITDERADQSLTGTLSEEELSQLTELIESLKVSSSKPSGVCADCFIYSIEISTPGKVTSAQADDVNLDESGLAPLVDFLTRFMSDALTK